METFARLLNALNCTPRLMGTILIAIFAGVLFWLYGPDWLADVLSNPRSYPGMLAVLVLLCSAGLFTYVIEAAAKSAYRECQKRINERRWIQSLPLLSVSQKHYYQKHVSENDKPHELSAERWKYILEHLEVIDTPNDPRLAPCWLR